FDQVEIHLAAGGAGLRGETLRPTEGDDDVAVASGREVLLLPVPIEGLEGRLPGEKSLERIGRLCGRDLRLRGGAVGQEHERRQAQDANGSENHGKQQDLALHKYLPL